MYRPAFGLSSFMATCSYLAAPPGSLALSVSRSSSAARTLSTSTQASRSGPFPPF